MQLLRWLGHFIQSEAAILTYRTKSGATYYTFSLERQADGSLACAILRMPAYGKRDTSLSVTHRDYRNGHYYVNLPTCNPLFEIEKVKPLVTYWCELTEQFIATGKSF